MIADFIPGGIRNMPKKIILLILLFTLLAITAGCGKEKPADDTPVPVPDVPELENKMPVVDNNGVILGEIDSRANCSAADGGIFYSIFELTSYNPTATAEYRFFNREDKTDVLLGKFENQGYEAFYARTELEGCIYSLAIRGKVGDDSSALVLLAFDVEKKTMQTFTVSPHGFPYAYMAAVNGKLLIMNHEMAGNKNDKIYEFDPADGAIKEVLTFSPATDSLRGICSADSGFYLLRLKINDGGENEMFVDHYDSDYSKTAETAVNEAMVNAMMEIPGMTGRQDALNEIGMNAFHFSMVDGRYLFYENTSITRIIIDIQSDQALLAKDDIYSISNGSGRPVVYRMDFDIDAESPEILELKDGELASHPFTPIETHKLVRSVSKSAAGTWVIMTSDDSRSFNWTLAVHLWTE